MNRRGFLKMLGAGAVVTAAGLMVPDVARKIFLPPRGGWATGSFNLQVGDIVTFEGVHDPLVIRRCKQFIVTGINTESKWPMLNSQFEERARYDAVWTLPNGEEKQYGMEFEIYANDPVIDAHNDKLARDMLESKMRRDRGTPGGKYFRLELPHNQIMDARYI